MKLVNHTDIPTETIRAIIRAVRPAGIGNFDVRISNFAGRGCVGRAYTNGSGYHATADPFLIVRVARTDARARHKGKARGAYLAEVWGSRVEAVIWVLAHELRHMWQAGGARDDRRRIICPRRGMVYGARGRFSERDADAYALQMLRRYRRGELDGIRP